MRLFHRREGDIAIGRRERITFELLGTRYVVDFCVAVSGRENILQCYGWIKSPVGLKAMVIGIFDLYIIKK